MLHRLLLARMSRGASRSPTPWAHVALVVAGLVACDEGDPTPADADSATPFSDGGSNPEAGPFEAGPQPATDAGQDAEAGSVCAASDPNVDADGDGFTPAQGDCDDCVPQINPGAYDVPGNAHDEDCDGTASPQAPDCQADLPLAPGSADDGARALGLCTFTTEQAAGWGVLEARFTKWDGEGSLDSPLQTGILPSFGAMAPLEGSRLLALSSGVARAPLQLGYTVECDGFQGPLPIDITDCGCAELDFLCIANCQANNPGPSVDGDAPPQGYPKASSECGPAPVVGSDVRIYNQAGLELTLRVPTNAVGLSFNSAFFTSEYPVYVCSTVNDFFVVLKTPRAAGAADDNILFDSHGDPVGVDSGLLAVCDPEVQSPDSVRQLECAQGPSLLEGTGYGPNDVGCGDDFAGNNSGASTGWLQTTTPVTPGEVITLRFVVWDTGDSTMDSSVLVDNFTWVLEEVGDAPGGPIDTETIPVLH